jgi:phosphate transport system protein
MTRHFVEEIEALKSNLIKMSGLAEEAIAGAIRALLDRRRELAERVIAEDIRINAMEVQIDETVVDLLALQQPVASDLRFILAALKINNDLERIGDHAVNIAESALASVDRGVEPAPVVELPRMAHITKEMLRNAIDGFIHADAGLCQQVLKSDDIIDDLNKGNVAALVMLMRQDPASLEQALDAMRVSRNLERVADLATNIAEDVIFAAEARVVKHLYGPSPSPRQ